MSPADSGASSIRSGANVDGSMFQPVPREGVGRVNVIFVGALTSRREECPLISRPSVSCSSISRRFRHTAEGVLSGPVPVGHRFALGTQLSPVGHRLADGAQPANSATPDERPPGVRLHYAGFYRRSDGIKLEIVHVPYRTHPDQDSRGGKA